MADWTEREHGQHRDDEGGRHTRDHDHDHDHLRHDDESHDTADAEPIGYRVEEYDDGANDDGADRDG